MTVLAILQARMSSRRLPGKVLIPILGRPMMGRQLDRLRRSRRIDKLVVATSTDPSDDVVADFATGEGCPCYRGSLEDVLGRFAGAMEASGPADHVVRLTADCPLADWRVIDAVIALKLESGADIATNSVLRTFPDGLDVEVFSASALRAAAAEATDPFEREHVTQFLYRRSSRFRIAHLVQPDDLNELRWTVDTPDDFEFVAAVYAALFSSNPDFGQSDILKLLEDRPGLVRRA